MTRFSSNGNARSWQFRPSDSATDAGLRRHHYGKVEPMDEPGARWSHWLLVGAIMAAIGCIVCGVTIWADVPFEAVP